MKKLVFFPSDPIEAYIQKGRTWEFIEEYYNPGGYFDDVYCLSPWGDKNEKVVGKIRFIKASPIKYAKIIKKIRPDVIRGYGGYCCADWASISKVKGIPVVVSVHDTNPELIHESLKYADGIICMSQAVKEAVVKLVPNVTPNIWVMPNRIDTNLFSNKYDADIYKELDSRFPGKYHVLHVGRKVEQKNLDTVIKSMKYLDKNIVTVFVGLGDSTGYKELAIKEGVSDRCYFVERVSNEQIPFWYSWCDCMCTPSRWEGFGYVFIEAASCESAIVTSNIGPMNEYLSNWENALLIDDYENPEEIAKAIDFCVKKSEKVLKMRKNAREVGLAFEKERIDKMEIAIYDKMTTILPNNKINHAIKRDIIISSFIEEGKKIVRRLRFKKE